MIIVDTSIWIEFFKNKKNVFSILNQELECQNVLAIECVFAELLQGAKNQREINIISEYWNNLPQIEESGLWIAAGQLSAKNKYFSKGIGLIDVFLIACTRKTKSKIWTLDKKLKSVLKVEEIYQSTSARS